MPKMKLADWAKKNGLSYLTANRHFHAGMIPNAQQLDSGTILVEDDSPESNMLGSSSNDAMSLFLKKTVEFSKNNASVEDFAAYVISNFSLKLAGSTDSPRYSRQKPKSADVQKHFQQFIPKSEKPKVNSFIMDPEAFEEIPSTNSTVSRVDVDQELVSQFSQAVSNPVSAAPTPGGVAGSMGVTESTVTRSVDLNTTPQPINYTGSNNLAFSSPSSFVPTYTAVNAVGLGGHTSTAVVHNTLASGIDNPPYFSSNGGVFLTDSLHGAALDSLEEISEDPPKPRSRRGRKPSKR